MNWEKFYSVFQGMTKRQAFHSLSFIFGKYFMRNRIKKGSNVFVQKVPCAEAKIIFFMCEDEE